MARGAPDTSFDPTSPDFPSERPRRSGTRESRLAEWAAKKGKKRFRTGGTKSGGGGGGGAYGHG